MRRLKKRIEEDVKTSIRTMMLATSAPAADEALGSGE